MTDDRFTQAGVITATTVHVDGGGVEEEDAKEEGIRIEALHLKPITHHSDGVDTPLNATQPLVEVACSRAAATRRCCARR